MWEHWKGIIAAAATILGIGATTVSLISGYGSRAINEGKAAVRLDTTERLATKHEDEIPAIRAEQAELKAQVQNLANGQSRVEQGQIRIERGQERIEQAIGKVLDGRGK